MLQAPDEPPIRHLRPDRLIRRLGPGGLAPVWLAEEAYHGSKLRDVAIKLFTLPERRMYAPGGALRWRQEIVNEARALCRVEHPNVVRFYTLQQDEERNVIGLVMEHVPGK